MQLLLACSPVTLRYCSVLQPEDNNLFTADTYRAPFPHLLRYTLSILPCKPLHAQDGCRVHNEGLPRPLLNPGKLLRDPIRLESPLLLSTLQRLRPLRMRTHRTMAMSVIIVAPRACMSGSTVRAVHYLSHPFLGSKDGPLAHG